MRDPIYRLDEIRVEKANAQLQQEKHIKQLEQELKEAKAERDKLAELCDGAITHMRTFIGGKRSYIKDRLKDELKQILKGGE